MMINSTGNLAGERSEVALSDCLCADTKRMCPAGMWMRVDMLPLPIAAAEFHGVSPQAGSIKTTRNRVPLHSEEASAWSIVVSMLSGSYSRKAMQEPVHRKREGFMTAPKFSSFGKVKQYVIPPVVEQLRGLPKSSVVARNMLFSARQSGGGTAKWMANLSWRP